MAKKTMDSCNFAACSSNCCLRWWGIILILFGVLYFGQDMAWWSFWKINWWTITFIMIGLWKLSRYYVE